MGVIRDDDVNRVQEMDQRVRKGDEILEMIRDEDEDGVEDEVVRGRRMR